MSAPPIGLASHLALIAISAPAERIKLLLQTQDEIILNLREESLAAHRHHQQQHQQQQHTLSKPQQSEHKDHHVKEEANNQEEEKREENEEEQDEDEEPRSIIVPYAQLPYQDMKDCAERIIEKEGVLSLWRGSPLECSRLVAQTLIGTLLYKRKVGSLFDIRRLFGGPPSLDSSIVGSAIWILGSSIQGTAINALALLAVYPLTTLQTKIAVDVLRKTKTPLKKIAPVSVAVTNAVVDSTPETTPEPFSSSEDSDSVEWVQHEEGGDHTVQDSTTTTNVSAEAVVAEALQPSSPVLEYVHVLSYKYRRASEIVKATVESEGPIGLYKGFSAVVASTFVSRIGFLTLYRTLSPLFICRSSSSKSSPSVGMGPSRGGLGAFLLVLSTTSIVNLIVYPLTTVYHRRMIAAPGRYSSSWDAGKQIVEKHGWKALYKGVEVVMVRDAVMAVLSSIFF
ncbi:hypothetical protein BGZ46_001353 [Entomortierella lignicola]|nr:hypothetical protein BGZ46_001353 [Entomortierella lignicola]